MDKAEALCDLRFVAAEYRLARPAGDALENSFVISIRPLAAAKQTFSVAEKNGEQFAAELDVLAALIRARCPHYSSRSARSPDGRSGTQS